jgi:hypothetical protein
MNSIIDTSTKRFNKTPIKREGMKQKSVLSITSVQHDDCFDSRVAVMRGVYNA